MRRDKQYQKWYREWKTSGLGQEAYCQQIGINYNTFKNECSRLRREGKLAHNNQVQKGRFQNVAIIEETVHQQPYCEVIFSEQDKITISSKESLKSLRGLFECLQGG